MPQASYSYVLCINLLICHITTHNICFHLDVDPSKRNNVSKESSSAASSRNATTSQVHPFVAGAPILIVPDAITSIFSGYNALEFLQDGRFVSTGNHFLYTNDFICYAYERTFYIV